MGGQFLCDWKVDLVLVAKGQDGSGACVTVGGKKRDVDEIGYITDIKQCPCGDGHVCPEAGEQCDNGMILEDGNDDPESCWCATQQRRPTRLA